MRSAAASFDDDIGYEEPARGKARRKGGVASGKKKSRKGRRFGFDMHKVARYAAIGMSATLALGIMVNALMFQKSRHPAPLFGKTRETSAVPTVAVKAPLPKAPPAAVEDVPPAAEPSPPVPMPKPRRVAGAPSSDRSAAVDPIARLLQGSASVSSGVKAEPRTVLSAQRALVKLGFVLKPNGAFGPATKKALKLFEKERHLPVQGELTHRLVKILAAESGTKID